VYLQAELGLLRNPERSILQATVLEQSTLDSLIQPGASSGCWSRAGQLQWDCATNDIIEVIDLSYSVAGGRANARNWKNGLLAAPMEPIYHPADAKVALRIRLNEIEFGGAGVVP